MLRQAVVETTLCWRHPHRLGELAQKDSHQLQIVSCYGTLTHITYWDIFVQFLSCLNLHSLPQVHAVFLLAVEGHRVRGRPSLVVDFRGRLLKPGRGLLQLCECI